MFYNTDSFSRFVNPSSQRTLSVPPALLCHRHVSVLSSPVFHMRKKPYLCPQKITNKATNEGLYGLNGDIPHRAVRYGD
jgi:hypothetical protein